MGLLLTDTVMESMLMVTRAQIRYQQMESLLIVEMSQKWYLLGANVHGIR